MNFLLAHSAWQVDQFPTCWPMNGLFVHWSRGWGVLSFSERLVLSALAIGKYSCNFKLIFFKLPSGNIPVNAPRPHLWFVNLGSRNALVPSGMGLIWDNTKSADALALGGVRQSASKILIIQHQMVFVSCKKDFNYLCLRIVQKW